MLISSQKDFSKLLIFWSSVNLIKWYIILKDLIKIKKQADAIYKN